MYNCTGISIKNHSFIVKFRILLLVCMLKRRIEYFYTFMQLTNSINQIKK